jgi:dihydrofolate synthase/folylpolyglutamate synthase
VITPLLSLITNIGYDHQKFLGDTLPQIAGEKAGIIKSGVPVVISERQNETAPVFHAKALSENSDITFAEDRFSMEDSGYENGKKKLRVKDLNTQTESEFRLSLGGNYQRKNLAGILASVEILQKIGFPVTDQALRDGLEKVKENTGLRGRWDVLQKEPLLVCDTAHNEDGVKEVIAQLRSLPHRNLWMVWGMVNDKDHGKVISLLPEDARYIACQPDIPRALSSGEMQKMLTESGRQSIEISRVENAISHCLNLAGKDDLIFVGGSTFTVASIPQKFF